LSGEILFLSSTYDMYVCVCTEDDIFDEQQFVPSEATIAAVESDA